MPRTAALSLGDVDETAMGRPWKRVICCCVSALALTLLAPGPAAAAPAWTQVTSGTTDDISAIEYQADDRLFFTTKNGKIFRREGSTFVQRLNAPGVVFNDIELRGQIGIAVGNAGVVYRSTDGGAQWAPITMPVSNYAPFCDSPLPFGDAHKVAFANDTVVYVFGGRGQIMRSGNGGASFVNHNQVSAAGPCKIDAQTFIGGAFFVPGALTPTGYFLEGRVVWFTNNDLQTVPQSKTSWQDLGLTRLAGDPANPGRQWALQVLPDSFWTSQTEDGWSTIQTDLVIGNRQQRQKSGLQDVAYNGGTVLMAGAAGQILNSIDGRTFFFVDAAPPLAAQEWRAVGLMSASKGAVGGTGGTLALSDNVNTIPDVVAPIGTISGPSAVTVGQPATFTAQAADEAGGSGLNSAAFSWTASGLPAQTGASSTFTFASAGTTTITVVLIDNAGNKKEVSRSVVVNAATAAPKPPPPASAVQKKSLTFPGGKITLSFPGRCVAANSSFRVRLAFKRSRRKGNVIVKVASVRFFVQGRSVFLDRRAPFVVVIKVGRARPGTTYKLRAQATLKVRRGKPPRRSIAATVKVC